MVDLQRLRVLRAVVQAGSINLAAERLGYTPSAVSQQISALQRETELVLIERRGRGIVPTAAGVALASRAGRVLEQLTDIEALTEDLRAGRSGTLRFGCFMSANRAWMPRVVAVLTEEFAELRIEIGLVELKGHHVIDPDIELYIAESMSAGRDPSAADGRADGYVVEELHAEDYLAVLPSAHPLARRGSLSIADLAEEPWVDNDHARGPCREIVIAACSAAGFAPRFRISAPDYASAFDYVAAGVGVTVLPTLGAFRLPESVAAVPIRAPAVRRHIMLRTKRSMRTHPAVERAIGLLKDAAAEPGESRLSGAHTRASTSDSSRA